jgi:molybdopterin molybdotransferase
VRLMLGKRQLARRTVPARAVRMLSSPPGRRQYRRGLLHREADGGYSVEPVGGPGSHLLAGLAQSNCLIVIDEEVTEVPEGDQVTVVPLLLASP